ncbi:MULTISPECIES: type IV secretion system protein VirB10 [Hyphomicrobiales]|jgi:type IV secretion system protein VirB10|uniref:Type IV secretion system protein VirB10 n=1 Tax=Methylorubrum populi TaxID=223967 RepID=A0A160PM00_9HYPH|nr:MULTISPECIES: type IV secretion system protein VirB10 [Hyphomicrobiales]MDH0699721.1 type IV secretion system protein VirB10 [Agrobacterium sp. GD03871]MDH1062568.1 type IV secretion system protein VirB10 [Agrobacterium sp. GD03992]MDH2228059.1 type IV secretion system protein VirB10 [Agrobacterium sp. GD03642]BAU94185.1 type IV secretion system protein VirB10 [Methylorubrum populi]
MTDTHNPPRAPDLPPEGAIEGERHVSEVAGRAPVISKRAGVGVIVAGAAIVCGVILLTSSKPNLKPDPGPPLTVRPAVTFVPPPPATPPPVPALPDQVPPLPTQPVMMPPAQPSPGQAAPAPRPQPRLLVYTSGAAGRSNGPGSGTMSSDPYGMGSQGVPAGYGGPPGQDGAGLTPAGFYGAPGGQGGQGGRDELAARLQPTQLTGVSANVLRNQPYLLTTGTLVPCILQTAMDSTLPGLVTCVIPQDIMGKTGLTLLDRGTRVVGQFRGGVQQGVERLFVLWTRAETPQGVVINLDSPASDPLGRAGMDGEVDRHFWQRFGGALLLSTVDGVIQAGVAAASKEGTTTINTGSTQSVIASSLNGSINIPPTVRKNQGELVSIFVARDLDFSTVYRVIPTPPRYVSESRRVTK